jgi:hypothetical protein
VPQYHFFVIPTETSDAKLRTNVQEPIMQGGRSWRRVEAAGFAAVGISTFATLLFDTDEIPIVLIVGAVYLALGGAV